MTARRVLSLVCERGPEKRGRDHRVASRRREIAPRVARRRLQTPARRRLFTVSFFFARSLLTRETTSCAPSTVSTESDRPVRKSTSVSGAPDNSSRSHFSAMARPTGLGRAARNGHHHAIEQASPRRRGGHDSTVADAPQQFDFRTGNDLRTTPYHWCNVPAPWCVQVCQVKTKN